MSTRRILATTLLVCATVYGVQAEEAPARKSAAELPEIKQLPNPFVFRDGSAVRTKTDWSRRRGELKALFEDYEYGHLPPKPEKMTVSRGDVRVDEATRSTRQDLVVTLEHAGKTLALHVGLTLPLEPKGPVPVVVQGGFGPMGAGRPGAPAVLKKFAPRALLATEGTQDSGTNPQGSQLTHLAARRVYDFLGASNQISIKYRPVGHIPSNEDLLEFADHVFFGKPLSDEFGKLAYPEEQNGFDWDVPK